MSTIDSWFSLAISHHGIIVDHHPHTQIHVPTLHRHLQHRPTPPESAFCLCLSLSALVGSTYTPPQVDTLQSVSLPKPSGVLLLLKSVIGTAEKSIVQMCELPTQPNCDVLTRLSEWQKTMDRRKGALLLRPSALLEKLSQDIVEQVKECPVYLALQELEEGYVVHDSWHSAACSTIQAISKALGLPLRGFRGDEVCIAGRRCR